MPCDEQARHVDVVCFTTSDADRPVLPVDHHANESDADRGVQPVALETGAENDGEDGYVSILTFVAFNQKRVEKMSHILCLGYKKGEGLGPNSKGIVNPVIPDTRYHGQHIGWDSQKN